LANESGPGGVWTPRPPGPGQPVRPGGGWTPRATRTGWRRGAPGRSGRAG